MMNVSSMMKMKKQNENQNEQYDERDRAIHNELIEARKQMDIAKAEASKRIDTASKLCTTSTQ